MVTVTVKIGPYEFDHFAYDATGDVLYLRRGRRGPPRTPSARPRGTPCVSTTTAT